MALVAGIQTTLTSYSLLCSQIQMEICDISEAITDATEQMSDLANEVADEKEYVRNNYDSDSEEYCAAMEEINDAYNATLAEIQAWESDLETQKEEKEMQAATYSSYIDSYQSLLSENIADSFKFGGGVGAQ